MSEAPSAGGFSQWSPRQTKSSSEAPCRAPEAQVQANPSAPAFAAGVGFSGSLILPLVRSQTGAAPTAPNSQRPTSRPQPSSVTFASGVGTESVAAAAAAAASSHGGSASTIMPISEIMLLPLASDNDWEPAPSSHDGPNGADARIDSHSAPSKRVKTQSKAAAAAPRCPPASEKDCKYKYDPFKCNWPGCKYESNGTGHMKRHLRTHTGERPYVCTWPGCSYAASQSGHLDQHLLAHTGERPFKCKWPGCDYSASRPGHLKRHMRVHARGNQPKSQHQGQQEPPRQRDPDYDIDIV